jgi:hypothetical protein
VNVRRVWPAWHLRAVNSDRARRPCRCCPRQSRRQPRRCIACATAPILLSSLRVWRWRDASRPIGRLSHQGEPGLDIQNSPCTRRARFRGTRGRRGKTDLCRVARGAQLIAARPYGRLGDSQFSCLALSAGGAATRRHSRDAHTGADFPTATWTQAAVLRITGLAARCR